MEAASSWGHMSSYTCEKGQRFPSKNDETNPKLQHAAVWNHNLYNRHKNKCGLYTKGLAHPKVKMLSLFTNPHVVPNPNKFFRGAQKDIFNSVFIMFFSIQPKWKVIWPVNLGQKINKSYFTTPLMNHLKLYNNIAWQTNQNCIYRLKNFEW